MAGRGWHRHAAMAAWWGEDLFCLEVLEWYGGRAVMLSSRVAGRPGRIDVYATDPEGRWPEFDRAGAVRMMRRLCGCRYGWRSLLAAALVHLPGVRRMVRPEAEEEASGSRPPYCSHACALAHRLGGRVDPVPHLADRLTEPADLARSALYAYRFTLVPS